MDIQKPGMEGCCIVSGMDARISKPIRSAQLHDVIEGMLETHGDGSQVATEGESPVVT